MIIGIKNQNLKNKNDYAKKGKERHKKEESNNQNNKQTNRKIERLTKIQKQMIQS